MNIDDIFGIMYQSSKSGSFGLFVGSGFAKAVIGKGIAYFHPLKWDELLIECCKQLEIDIDDIETSYTSSPAIASAICQKLKEKESITDKEAELKLKIIICQLTAYYPHKDHSAKYTPLLDSLDLTWVITTNYDLLLDSLLSNSYSIGPTSAMNAPKGFIPVFHIHGIRTEPDSIVINNSDYLLMSRPHEYRMDTLSMRLKESTTLMIGYSISDTNVLAAIDLANNVYQNKSALFQNKLIQFVHDSSVTVDFKVEEIPEYKLYRVYGDSIERFLEDYKTFKQNLDNIITKQEITNKSFITAMDNLDSSVINSFITNSKYRNDVLDWYNIWGDKHLNSFIRFVNKSFDVCWFNASKPGAFAEYKKIIELIIDLLCYIKLEHFHPMIFSSIISNFESVSCMVGHGFGESWESKDYWNSHKDKIPKDTLRELYIISKQHLSYFFKLLYESFPNLENEIKL